MAPRDPSMTNIKNWSYLLQRIRLPFWKEMVSHPFKDRRPDLLPFLTQVSTHLIMHMMSGVLSKNRNLPGLMIQDPITKPMDTSASQLAPHLKMGLKWIKDSAPIISSTLRACSLSPSFSASNIITFNRHEKGLWCL